MDIPPVAWGLIGFVVGWACAVVQNWIERR